MMKTTQRLLRKRLSDRSNYNFHLSPAPDNDDVARSPRSLLSMEIVTQLWFLFSSSLPLSNRTASFSHSVSSQNGPFLAVCGFPPSGFSSAAYLCKFDSSSLARNERLPLFFKAETKQIAPFSFKHCLFFKNWMLCFSDSILFFSCNHYFSSSFLCEITEDWQKSNKRKRRCVRKPAILWYLLRLF